MPTHTGTPKTGRLPGVGDVVEVLAGAWWALARVCSPVRLDGAFAVERDDGRIVAIGVANDDASGLRWRWPDEGGGSFEVLAVVGTRHKLKCRQCADVFLSDGALPESCSKCDATELPSVRRCPERISDPGEAIENCDTVIGREVSCFVCKASRCFIHCGCLAHHRGAKVISRGCSAGGFEWCVWELDHGFRGQLFAPAADGSGLKIRGTHGGASADAVIATIMRNIERLQSADAADESENADPVDPERELRRLDARVRELLDRSRRSYDRVNVVSEQQRVRTLRICQDWLRSTERSWRDLADDGEQNPRLVFQCKELHDQQTADLFWQLGQLFNGGAS